MYLLSFICFFFFFFNDTATTEIYTLSLHDALPISPPCRFSCATSAPIPYRASSASRRGVTEASSSTRDNPDPVISATRCSALTICGPDGRAGPVRHRSGPPPLQLRHPAAGRHHQQRIQRRPFLIGRRRVQALPQPPCRGILLPRHQPGQRGHPGSSTSRSRSHPPRQRRSPSGCPRSPTPACPHTPPAPPPPARSPSASAPCGSSGMVEMRLLPLRVLLHTRRIGDLQLAGQVVDDLGRHPFQRIRQEPADITNRGELDTETEPIVITPQPATRAWPASSR